MCIIFIRFRIYGSCSENLHFERKPLLTFWIRVNWRPTISFKSRNNIVNFCSTFNAWYAHTKVRYAR